jgi:O-antigen ligase
MKTTHRNPAPTLRGTSPASHSRLQSHSSLPLGFESGAQLGAFAVLCLLCLAMPHILSGFWLAAYDEFVFPSLTGPLTGLWMLCGLTALAALLLAISPRPEVSTQLDASTHNALWKRAPVTFWLCAFFAWSLLGVFTSVYKHDSLVEIARLLCTLGIFLVARELLSTHDSETFQQRATVFVACLVAGAFLAAAPALWDFAQTRARQFGPFSNNNFFASYLAMSLPLALSGCFLARRARNNFALGMGILAALAICGALFSTTSKGGFLALMVAIIAFAICTLRARGEAAKDFARRNRVLVLVASIAIVAAGSLVIVKTVGPRLLEARDGDENSTQFRLYTWRATTEMANARPIFGQGPGTFPSVQPQFAQTRFTYHAHQSWLQIAAESGWPALLFFVFSCGSAVVCAWEKLRSHNWPFLAAGIASVAAFAAHSFTDSGWQTTPSIALLLLCVLALIERTATYNNDIVSTHNDESASRLRFSWLGATMVFLLCALGMQRVVSAEDARREAFRLAQNGSFSASLEKAEEANSLDPLSARMQLLLGGAKDRAQQNSEMSYERATQLQLTSAVPWHRWAQSRIEREKAGQVSTQLLPPTSQLLDETIKRDPLNTEFLLERAQWRLNKNQSDAQAWRDLQKIVGLRDAPYGKYPALADQTDLNFARASILLARRALKQDQKSAAQKLIARSLEEVKRAEEKAEYWREVSKASPEAADLAPDEDLNEIRLELKQLQGQLEAKP